MSKRKVAGPQSIRLYKDQESRVQNFQRERNIKLLTEQEAHAVLSGNEVLRELIDAGLEANGFPLNDK